ncbi:MAG: prepilin-type N-terminal cleavage/methylation domain-containing protein [Patescibacteria group bacterium]
MSNKIIYNKKGQSLLELIIAMAIFILIVSSIMFLVLDAHTSDRQGLERTQATLLAQEGAEAAASIANRGWRNLADGKYGINDKPGHWDWQPTPDVIDNIYTRQTAVETVNRDTQGEITDTGGLPDPDTKKVTTKVSWDFTIARPSEVTIETYLTNWRSLKWRQSTQAEFDLGVKDQVVTALSDDGEVVLAQNGVQGENNWTFDTAGDYAYDAAKIEVTSSVSRLISQSLLGSGRTTNPGFNTTLAPWQYFDWDQDAGEVNVAGSRQTSGGHPGAYARVRIPRGRNYQVGGFFQQKFSVTEDNPTTATLTFDGRVSGFAGTPVSLEVFAFLDTVPGEPVAGTEVWSSGPISGTTSWGTITADITPILAQAGTYYLKLAAWAVAGSANAGIFDIGFDNASVYWEKAGTSYPTDGPSINPSSSFRPAVIVSWSGFQETAVKNGGEIYYQLSDNNGTSWSYWNGTAWAAAGAADYNTAADVNSHISSYPTNRRRLMFRAFLVSDGTQQIILDNVRASYLISNPTNYAVSGSLESSAFDTGGMATIYNYLSWTADEPAGTGIQFQLRTADTQANLNSATWVGPDGTAASFYTEPNTLIGLDHGATGQRWVQYKAYLSSDGSTTPVLKDITIDYEP